MKEKSKYLFKNIAVLTIGNLSTKLLTILLIPLYTFALTTSEYGTYDLINISIGLIVPIFTLNIMEGIFRFSLDTTIDKKELIGIGNKYFIYSLLGIGIILWINYLLDIIPIFNQYVVFFFLMFALNGLLGILTSIAKGFEKLSVIAVSGIVSSIVMISLNIVFLLVFKWGLTGYFLANISGMASQCLYIAVSIRLWKYISNPFSISQNIKNLEKEVTHYSAPLIANSIGWWVNNVSDRYIVTGFCGVAANGVYSLAYKLPSVLNVLASIFNQAWNLSAIKDFDKNDREGFFSKTYSNYNCAMVLICSSMIIADKNIAKLFFANDFYVAWKYVPFLIIASFFGALAGYIGGIFSAVKRSDIYAKSTVIGAVINVILNIILVYSMGVQGAAIATVISYIVVWAIRYIELKNFINIKINIKRDLFSYVLLIVQAIILIISKNNLIMYSIEIGSFAILMFLFKKELKCYFTTFMSKFRRIL